MPKRYTAAQMDTEPHSERQNAPTPMGKSYRPVRRSRSGIPVGKAEIVRRSSLKEQRRQMEAITKRKAP
jgi:hypothetical protein